MIIDARSVPSGTILETEVCIVGAGAAGITLAREFIAAPFRVVLLESGGMKYDQETQDLYEGQSVGRTFEDLTLCRLRYFGGTTNHWGGWCLPFDAIDFEPRDDLPNHGWPFPKSHLDSWYQRAQDVCQLGPYDYRPASWGIMPNEVPPPFSGPDFECKILQENPLRFGPAYASALRQAPRVTVYLHANAFNFDAGENGDKVKELAVKTLSGNDFTVRAQIYILAVGGVENARLLLASGKEGSNGPGQYPGSRGALPDGPLGLPRRDYYPISSPDDLRFSYPLGLHDRRRQALVLVLHQPVRRQHASAAPA